MATNRIKDQGGDRKYFIITPQLVWGICDSPYEYTLWNVIKMIAGDEGECFLSTDDLAAAAMMSTGKASQCRATLIEQGLLEGEVRKDPGYPQPVWHLTIPDLWKANLEWRERYASLKDRIDLKRKQKSLHQMKPSLREGGTSPDETKKNQQNIQVEPEEPPPADSPPFDDSWPKDRPPTKGHKPHSAEQVKAGIRHALEQNARNGNGRAGVADPTQDDPWIDKPVRAWCAFIRLPYEQQPTGRAFMFAHDLRDLAAEVHKTPDDVYQAIRAMSQSASCEWLRTASRPTHRGFAETLQNVLCGQVLPEGGKANGGPSGPRQHVTVDGFQSVPEGGIT